MPHLFTFRITTVILFFTLLSFSLHAQTETEPNNSLETANTLSVGTDLTGEIGCDNDRADWFVAELPDDGKLRLIVTYTNTGDQASSASSTVRVNASTLYASGGSGTLQPGESSTDTVTVSCLRRQTVYIPLQSSTCFSYTIRCEVESPDGDDDGDGNETFATAAELFVNTTVEGRLGYRQIGGFTDRADWYTAELPDDGTLRLIVTYTNTGDRASSASSSVRVNVSSLYASGGSGTLQPGESSTDTVTVSCLRRQTVYIPLQASTCFSYTVRYELDSPRFADDAAANDTPQEADEAIDLSAAILGRVGFRSLQDGTDPGDFFRLPATTERTAYRIRLEAANENPEGSGSIIVQLRDANNTTYLNRSFSRSAAQNLSTTLDVNCAPAGQLYLYVRSSGCFSYRMNVRVECTEPSAELTFTRYGNRIAFSANTRQVDDVLWTFGDGSSSTLREPVKEFAPGTYTVNLRATNTACSEVLNREETIEVSGIEYFTPERAGMIEPLGFFDLRMFGAGFTDATELILTRGSTVLRPFRMGVPEGGNELTALFRFNDAVVGTYDVAVTLADGETYRFPEGFEIFQDNGEQTAEGSNTLIAEVDGPSRIRTNRWTTYRLEVTNNYPRIANGVTACFVTPPGVETDLTEVIQPYVDNFEVDADTWDELSLDYDSFNEFYSDGTFNPAANTRTIDYRELYDQRETLLNVPVDSIFGEAFEGELHTVYIPLIRANSTYTLRFRMRSDRNQTSPIIAFAFPQTFRQNPPTNTGLDVIHDVALQLGGLGRFTNEPRLKALARSVGFVDLSSQDVFAFTFDAMHRTNTQELATAERLAFLGPEAVAAYVAENDPLAAANVVSNYMKNRVERAGIVKKWADNGVLDLFQQRRLLRELSIVIEAADNLRAAGFSEQQILDQLYDLRHKFVESKGVILTKKDIEELIDAEVEDEEPDDIDEREVESLNSFDPNAIYGEDGPGEERFIRRSEELSYLIAFENLDTALAAAQIVRIETNLDPTKFDLRRTDLGDISFGGTSYPFEEDRREYFTDIDLRPAQNLIVRASAKLDTLTGDLRWQFISLDPQTMELTEDVDAGFLPPNKLSPEGEGAVSFRTRLLPDVAGGDVVSAQANIFFDENEPILTNIWSNTVDEAAPVSSLNATATMINDSVFTVSYTGDDAQGSGIAKYFLKVSLNGSPYATADFSLESDGTTQITGTLNNRYDFYLETRDSVGNRERKTPTAELTVILGTVSTSEARLPESAITLFPNPTTGRITLQTRELRGTSLLTVTDLLGREQLRRTVDLGGGAQVPVELGTLSGGVYTVRVQCTDGKYWVRQLSVRK
jgi:PKD repeat protein